MEQVITTEKLSKSYKDVTAVDSISLNVRKGEIYGFLGLNGAGKTTTIRMLLGMINPTSGAAYINGKKVHANNTALWSEIGYMVEVPYSYPELTVRENLEIVRRLRSIQDKNAVRKIVDCLKLTPYLNRKSKNLSLGNAQRLGLAKALIHNPNILILDEPSNGLDPAGIFEIRELLSDLAHNHGVSIFISSHILGEISRFASRIGIIHQGRLIQEINTDELEKLSGKQLLINTSDNERAAYVLSLQGYVTETISSFQLCTKDKRAINRPEDIAVLLVKNDVPPSLLQIAEEDLESYFLRTISMKGE